MQKTLILPGLLLGLAFASNAVAADCPTLPQGAGVQWEETEGKSHKVCRAIDQDGTQLLGVMFTDSEPLKLRRRNRVEEGWVGQHVVVWYRPEIAEAGAAEKRITVVELDEDRYAQIWLDANDPDQLRRAMNLAQQLYLH